MNWAPGTLAKVTFEGKEYVAFWDGCNEQWVSFRLYANDRHPVTDVRPLVVLDLSEAPSPTAVPSYLRYAAGNPGRVGSATALWLADQIEAQTKPPKPVEPLGQYAVVRDRNDSLWVRLNQTHWYSEASPNNNQTYGEIDAVEVVREGVTP